MRRGARRWMLGMAAAWLLGSCTFPDFIVIEAGVGGAAGTAGSPPGPDAGAAGEGAQGGTSNLAGSVGNAGEAPGTSGQGGEGGETPIDVGKCGPRSHPLHCLNHVRDEDETDVDCGGPRCSPCAADEACVQDRDCTSGTCDLDSNTCTRLFTLQYVREIDQAETASFHFHTALTYLGADAQKLSDITLRYYFSRNGVTEPILPGGSTFVQPGNTNISGKTRFEIVRQLRGDGLTNDAYLEFSFDPSGVTIVTQGQELDLEGIATTGDGTSLFNQKTHYSFDQETSLHESKHLVVYLKGKRAWGSPPPVDDPPSCIHLGVNLDGPAVTVGSDPWLGSPASPLDRYIDAGPSLRPATDPGREEMIRSGFFFHDGDSFAFPTDNGEYELLAYAWSASGGETGTLKVQGTDRDKFRATSFDGGSPWVALGPYRITIGDGQLSLGAKGDLRLGGFELRLLDE